VHATNSLVINDVLNVFGSLFIDAQNLTVATNGCGNGATSIDGELESGIQLHLVAERPCPICAT